MQRIQSLFTRQHCPSKNQSSAQRTLIKEVRLWALAQRGVLPPIKDTLLCWAVLAWKHGLPEPCCICCPSTAVVQTHSSQFSFCLAVSSSRGRWRPPPSRPRAQRFCMGPQSSQWLSVGSWRQCPRQPLSQLLHLSSGNDNYNYHYRQGCWGLSMNFYVSNDWTGTR